MKFKVQMLAFGQPGEIREVEVPQEKIMGQPPKTIEQQLDEIYYYGQNEFQPQQHPSVSMGDVIEYSGDYWLVCGIGFRKMTQAGYIKYLGVDRRDRSFVDPNEFCEPETPA
jgi:hypothetical protein